ncbi:solute carrier family 66 member 2 isoform X1 [Parasteatoda tepidariorum]|nr:solute carrier family 66 member 2 isoform X1 [Parasteatoda tepidariorum]XP_015922298.1 solute carrier family 66 member 2 isoform X1 [Parasteatoda tepidariorum]XP_042894961.1 solute carrier family 66 member 2 isoform X1 [Parasteatoda tepidariorum]XP_042894964.1 solute carrier family 66 member 2 isoform X1 [Parasteatoda tepidariorum]
MPTEWPLDTSQTLELLSLKNIFSWFSSGAMIIGGIVPYIPQYREIRKTDNADGFSTYVCLVLLIANTLRIIFWFGHPFEIPLLLQSIIMNIAMLAMIQLCVQVRNKTVIVPTKNRIFSEKEEEGKPEVSPNCTPRSYWDLDAKYFWEWTDFLSYVEFLATFTAIMGIFMYICMDIIFIVELIGFLAVFIEAMLGAPQFYRNLRKKSTLGMSKKMVGFWTIGDVFKTSYFYIREAPFQFWLCGILQIGIDILIVLQILFYRVTPSPVKLLLKGETHTN